MNKNNWKEQAHQEIEIIFRVLLPEYGFAIREEQISLCHFMLDTMLQNHISLCDAGVGIGKTYAYLTACVMMQKFYPKGWHVSTQPVVISTSSIALQNALMKEYIPFLSHVFLENHILSEPIRAIVRKGKERFVCDMRLFKRLTAVQGTQKNKGNMRALQSLQSHYDLDCVTGLSGFDRRRVCVPRVCEKDCWKRNTCRYHQYLREAKSKDIFIQVCNHNYLLAYTAHRSTNLSPLLNDYGALIVDEAHKLPEAAQQMYGYRISPDDLEEICTLLTREKRLHASQRLREKFVFLDTLRRGPCTAEMQRTDFCLTPQCKSALGETISLLHHTAKRLDPYLPRWIIHRLEETAKILTLFYTTDQQYVFYLEYGQQGIPTLCATSRNLPAQLGQALWEKKIPAILTSGTLAAGQQFGRTKQVLGLSGKQKVDTFAAVSPFDYEKNCLLYLPDHLCQSRKGVECLS